MNSKKKKALIKLGFKILVIVLAIIVIVKIVNSNNSNQDDINQNGTNQLEMEQNNQVGPGVNMDLASITKVVDGLEFSDIKMEKKSENEIEFSANVQNQTDSIIESRYITITCKTSNGDEVFGAYLSSIPAGDSTTLFTAIRKNISNIQDIEFEIGE